VYQNICRASSFFGGELNIRVDRDFLLSSPGLSF
jgi:hypothetical protein